MCALSREAVLSWEPIKRVGPPAPIMGGVHDFGLRNYLRMNRYLTNTKIWAKFYLYRSHDLLIITKIYMYHNRALNICSLTWPPFEHADLCFIHYRRKNILFVCLFKHVQSQTCFLEAASASCAVSSTLAMLVSRSSLWRCKNTVEYSVDS